jgi:hypothetical protein
MYTHTHTDKRNDDDDDDDNNNHNTPFMCIICTITDSSRCDTDVSQTHAVVANVRRMYL